MPRWGVREAREPSEITIPIIVQDPRKTPTPVNVTVRGPLLAGPIGERMAVFDYNVDRDVVFARVETDGQLVFAGVSLHAGHSTYRIIPAAQASALLEEPLRALKELGCTWEEVPPQRLLSVDVPSSVNVFEVYRLLEAGESAGVWSFEEGHCGHVVDAGPPTQ